MRSRKLEIEVNGLALFLRFSLGCGVEPSFVEVVDETFSSPSLLRPFDSVKSVVGLISEYTLLPEEMISERAVSSALFCLGLRLITPTINEKGAPISRRTSVLVERDFYRTS
jgi:hypothetical protein